MQAIIIHEKDNVAVALDNLKPGQTMKAGSRSVYIKEYIPKGHKVALSQIPKGREIIKYGCPIGEAAEGIEAGQWVHSHNLKTGLSRISSYDYQPETRVLPLVQEEEEHFWGYLRGDGQVGIRNEIWIIPTVGCVNGIGRKLAQAADREAKGRIDGIHCFEHPYGCSQLGEDQENTKSILLGLCKNPNAGGILVLGLGCENLNLNIIKQDLESIQGKPICTLNCQDIDDEQAVGMELLRSMTRTVQKSKRTLQPVSKLRLGVKCGGSDGYSGITANPLVGKISEAFCSKGASVFMTEVPEMFGAEKILFRQCKNRDVVTKLVNLINEFKQYYLQHGQPIYENPSPGNKKGGITTLEEKSLGCVQKCGRAIITGIWPYGSQAMGQGLHLIGGPGNDLVSATALAAAGAQLILFTTGRGTPVGAPVPTIKVATNTDLFQRKNKWMDFNAGAMMETGNAELLKEQLTTLIFEVAEGKKKTRNEENEIRELAVFKQGVIL